MMRASRKRRRGIAAYALLLVLCGLAVALIYVNLDIESLRTETAAGPSFSPRPVAPGPVAAASLASDAATGQAATRLDLAGPAPSPWQSPAATSQELRRLIAQWQPVAASMRFTRDYLAAESRTDLAQRLADLEALEKSWQQPSGEPATADWSACLRFVQLRRKAWQAVQDAPELERLAGEAYAGRQYVTCLKECAQHAELIAPVLSETPETASQPAQPQPVNTTLENPYSVLWEGRRRMQALAEKAKVLNLAEEELQLALGAGTPESSEAAVKALRQWLDKWAGEGLAAAELEQVEPPHRADLLARAQGHLAMQEVEALFLDKFRNQPIAQRLRYAHQLFLKHDDAPARERLRSGVREWLFDVLKSKEIPQPFTAGLKEARAWTKDEKTLRLIIGAIEPHRNRENAWNYWKSRQAWLTASQTPDLRPLTTDYATDSQAYVHIKEPPKPPFALTSIQAFNSKLTALRSPSRILTRAAWQELAAFLKEQEIQAADYRGIVDKHIVYPEFKVEDAREVALPQTPFTDAYRALSFAAELELAEQVLEHFRQTEQAEWGAAAE